MAPPLDSAAPRCRPKVPARPLPEFTSTVSGEEVGCQPGQPLLIARGAEGTARNQRPANAAVARQRPDANRSRPGGSRPANRFGTGPVSGSVSCRLSMVRLISSLCVEPSACEAGRQHGGSPRLHDAAGSATIENRTNGKTTIRHRNSKSLAIDSDGVAVCASPTSRFNCRRFSDWGCFLTRSLRPGKTDSPLARPRFQRSFNDVKSSWQRNTFTSFDRSKAASASEQWRRTSSGRSRWVSVSGGNRRWVLFDMGSDDEHGR